jgi:hypothetical protein
VFGLAIVPNRVVRAGKEDARVTVAAGRLIEVINTPDIASLNQVIGAFHGHAAQVYDCITTRHNRGNLRFIRQIALHELFVFGQILNHRDIGQANNLSQTGQTLSCHLS